MSLLNIVLLAGIISVTGSWACTPPQETSSRGFSSYKISSYASEFPGSAQSDFKFSEIVNRKKEAPITADSKSNSESNSDAKKQEIVATVIKRSSSGSPRNSLCMITSTNLSNRITRQLAPLCSPEE